MTANTLNGSPTEIAADMQRMIENAIPGARAEVSSVSPGHYTISVIATAFAGQSMVTQQQTVYAAIQDFLRGDSGFFARGFSACARHRPSGDACVLRRELCVM